MGKIRILIDLDNTLYDLCTPWLLRYNNDYPHHQITYKDILGWDTSQYVAPECGKKIYDYFQYEDVWINGDIIDPISIDITKLWLRLGYDIAICTTTANSISASWKLRWVDHYFPHITERIVTTGHTKHWVTADFLIDDGAHNHKHFDGISILYDMPWNRDVINLPRAANWSDVNRMVMRSIDMLANGSKHKDAQNALIYETKELDILAKSMEGIRW